MAISGFPTLKIHTDEKNYRLITSDFNKGCFINLSEFFSSSNNSFAFRGVPLLADRPAAIANKIILNQSIKTINFNVHISYLAFILIKQQWQVSARLNKFAGSLTTAKTARTNLQTRTTFQLAFLKERSSEFSLPLPAAWHGREKTLAQKTRNPFGQVKVVLDFKDFKSEIAKLGRQEMLIKLVHGRLGYSGYVRNPEKIHLKFRFVLSFN